MIILGGHSPGNQGNQRRVRGNKKRSKSGNLRKKEKILGILTDCPNVKVSPRLKFNLIAVSTKMLYEEVMENSLRSGEMRVEQESGYPVLLARRPPSPFITFLD